VTYFSQFRGEISLLKQIFTTIFFFSVCESVVRKVGLGKVRLVLVFFKPFVREQITHVQVEQDSDFVGEPHVTRTHTSPPYIRLIVNRKKIFENLLYCTKNSDDILL